MPSGWKCDLLFIEKMKDLISKYEGRELIKQVQAMCGIEENEAYKNIQAVKELDNIVNIYNGHENLVKKLKPAILQEIARATEEQKPQILDKLAKDELKTVEDVKSFRLGKEDYGIPFVETLETAIQKNDIFSLGKHRLMCGDAYSDVATLLNGAKADVLLTDPPYGIKAVEHSGILSKHYKPIQKDSEPFNPKFLLGIAPITILFGANYYCDKLPISSGWVIWWKHTEGKESTDQGDCELIWTNQKKPCKLYKCVWTGYWREGESNKNPRIHPAQKPIKLLTNLIMDYSKEKMTILDLFGGSGSTLIAAEQTNRSCYMMEIDPKYCQAIINRWETYTNKKATKI